MCLELPKGLQHADASARVQFGNTTRNITFVFSFVLVQSVCGATTPTPLEGCAWTAPVTAVEKQNENAMKRKTIPCTHTHTQFTHTPTK